MNPGLHHVIPILQELSVLAPNHLETSNSDIGHLMVCDQAPGTLYCASKVFLGRSLGFGSSLAASATRSRSVLVAVGRQCAKVVRTWFVYRQTVGASERASVERSVLSAALPGRFEP